MLNSVHKIWKSINLIGRVRAGQHLEDPVGKDLA